LINYNYICHKCEFTFVTRRSIRDPILVDCPGCGSPSLEVVPHAVSVIDTTPRTIGGQADRNFSRAGAYEREARHRDIELARQRARAEGLPDGMESARKPDADGTWWRPNEKQVKPELVRADPATKRRYLEEGKI
jgi:putative FmdB family regulatory protein